MKLKLFNVFFVAILLSSFSTKAQNVYQEANGILVIEAENTDYASTDTKWAFRNANSTVHLAGYKGIGYIEYAGPDSFNSPSSQPVIYKFKIQNPGTYNLVFRTWKNHNHNPAVDDPKKFEEDRNNDCWIKMEGDYDANTSYVRNVAGAELSDLQAYNKFIGHGTDWGRTMTMEVGSHTFREVVYKFKAGEEYLNLLL